MITWDRERINSLHKQLAIESYREVLNFIEKEYGAYPDGIGNLWFDTEAQEIMFILLSLIHI